MDNISKVVYDAAIERDVLEEEFLMPQLDELFLLGLLNFAKTNDIELEISTITHPEWAYGIQIKMTDGYVNVVRIISIQDLLLAQNHVVMDLCNWMLDEFMTVKAEYEKGN